MYDDDADHRLEAAQAKLDEATRRVAETSGELCRNLLANGRRAGMTDPECIEFAIGELVSAAKENTFVDPVSDACRLGCFLGMEILRSTPTRIDRYWTR